MQCSVDARDLSLVVRITFSPESMCEPGDTEAPDVGVECVRMTGYNPTADQERSQSALVFLLGALYTPGSKKYWQVIKRNLASTQWPWIQGNVYRLQEAPELTLTIDQSSADSEQLLFVPYANIQYNLHGRTNTSANQFGRVVATRADECVHLWMLPLLLAYHPVLLASGADAEALYKQVADACRSCYAAALTRGLISQRFMRGMQSVSHIIAARAAHVHRANVAAIQQIADAGAAPPPPLMLAVECVPGGAPRRSRVPSSPARRSSASAQLPAIPIVSSGDDTADDDCEMTADMI